jgi:ADP-dependent NAD(P)H-hydrate dehydratase / NAD(P)H-hydrate epimerase
MFGLYPAAVVRRAEDSLLARVPEGSLMQIASRGLATNILRLAADIRGSVVGARVVLLIGAGNNGGDALFAGAYLSSRGMSVTAVPVADSWHVEGAQALVQAGGRIASVDDVDRLLDQADVIIDGIVGIGARGGLRQPAADVVEAANAADALRVAVDIPSGIGVDDGSFDGVAFEADVTVTFGCYKPGLFLHPGRENAGAVHLVDIGLDDELPEPAMRVLDLLDAAEFVPGPQPDDHKYHRGVVGIAAGSAAYPGAAVLSVGSARYSGVGMVRFLDRGDGLALRVVDTFPDVVADPRDARSDERVRAWGCGPGFTDADVQTVAMMIEEPTPIVLDAGALHCVASSEGLQAGIRSRADRGLTTVLTPHEGEYLRLFSAKQPAEFAASWGVIVVRKGPATTITSPDGTVFVDPMGTPDLAYAGSGDVLTGLMAGLLAANPHDDAAEVAAAAVWLHGLCGRIAAAGERPVTAVDISAAVPEVIAAIRTGNLEGFDL